MNSSELSLVGSYNLYLVVLSVAISVFASYAALDLAGRVASAHGKTRGVWWSGGATTMGIGIWSMHYVGMLAFRLPVAVKYDWPTVALSLLAAIFASAIALFVASRNKMGTLRAISGSLLMGSGIAGMHYIGMSAMRLPASCHYSWRIVASSVILAIAISLVALVLAFYFRSTTASVTWRKVASALVMGAAIPVMHYTGMAAATFTPSNQIHGGLAHALNISSLVTTNIIVVTLMLLGLTILTALVDRRFSAQAMELASSEQKSWQILATSFDAFVGTDSSGSITDWNAQAERLFGWQYSEVVGKALSVVIIPAADRAAYERNIHELRAAGSEQVANRRFEATASRREGEEIPIEITISALSRGNSPYLAAFVRDLTHEKETEKALCEAKDLAEASSHAKSDFLAMISHEIRTPMNGIIGMAGLLLDTPLNPEQTDFAETLRRSAEALLTIINDILDFSKIEAGKMTIEPIPCDLRVAIEEASELLRAKIKGRDLDLIVRYSLDAPHMVVGDAGRIRQIVLNLAGNAIKFTDHGHVFINVECVEKDSRRATLRVTIEDTGIGIPQDKLERIFDKFTQADSSTTRQFGGTGLGLSISRQLVELMGGELHVESKLGKGSTFWFTLPVELSDEPEPKPIQSGELQGVRVIIVDDNETNRVVLREQIKHFGLRCGEYSSAETALIALRQAGAERDPFQIAILDHQMPGMDGEALGRAIKADPSLSETILVMLTSCGQKGDGDRMKEAGFAAYLLKPTREAKLLEALVGVWRNSRLPAAHKRLVTRHTLAEAEPNQALKKLPLSVLLVDDNEVNQKVASRMLEKIGCRIDLAANGRIALEILKSKSYDVVFMDCQMPEMDGFATTHEIRRREGTNRHVPIVAMTANAMQGDRERCLDAGMDAYISKPIKIADITNALDSLKIVPESERPEHVETN